MQLLKRIGEPGYVIRILWKRQVYICGLNSATMKHDRYTADDHIVNAMSVQGLSYL